MDLTSYWYVMQSHSPPNLEWEVFGRGHTSPKPVTESNPSRRGASLRDHPIARSTYLVARAMGDQSRESPPRPCAIEIPSHLGTEPFQAQRSRVERNCVAPIMVVAPSME